MLHMVVFSHGPDTCPAVHPDLGDKARNGMAQMEEVSKKHEVKVEGFWGDPPGHTFYLLADAPNAHAVNDVMVELELFHWNTVDIRPVKTMEEVMPLAAGS